MVRSWEGVVWALVISVAVAVAVRMAAGADTAASPGIRLNEILAGPARDWDGDGLYDAKSDEWIEIQNVSTSPLILDDFRLTDAERTVRFAFSGTLAQGAVKLLTGSEAVAWQRAAGLSTSGLSLNNSGDVVHLLHVTGTDTIVVDVRSYGSIEGAPDRSVGRASTGSDEWILFDGLNRYTGSGTPSGTGCAPTPGGVNGCTTDVRETTWGAIKRLYR